MKFRAPSILRTAYWKWRQRRVTVLPWSRFAADCPMAGKSLAIVGNAGYLRDLRQGDYIDQHDLVLRMNNFAVRGFESAVGRRLDIFLTNFFYDINFSNPDLEQARYLVASVPNNFRKLRRERILNRHGEHITAGLCQLGRRVVYAPPFDDFRRWVRQYGRYPTTGATAILFALDYLAAGCSQIYVTGFSFFEGQSHYFSDRAVDPSTNHDMPSEKRQLRDKLAAPLASRKVIVDPVMAGHLGIDLSATPTRRAS